MADVALVGSVIDDIGLVTVTGLTDDVVGDRGIFNAWMSIIFRVIDSIDFRVIHTRLLHVSVVVGEVHLNVSRKLGECWELIGTTGTYEYPFVGHDFIDIAEFVSRR